MTPSSTEAVRAKPEQPLRHLTAAEIHGFVTEGVICARGVIPPEWITRLAPAIERNIAKPTPSSKRISIPDERFFGDVFMWLHDPDFQAFVTQSPTAVLARQILAALGATGTTFFYDQLFVKEPGTQVRTPWHHDLTYWPIAGQQVCSIWMPLDPVTSATSGLSYVRGSHRWTQRFKAITPDRNDYMINPALDDTPDIDADPRYELLAWDMQPGDVLIFHPLIVHGSGANTSTTTRRRAVATRWLGDDVVFRDLPYTMPLPPGHGLADGSRFGGPMFPRFELAVRL
jgi:ectoine hydroxylase-related dioxygenase (phytanoyl-CoA dioxygenase family)